VNGVEVTAGSMNTTAGELERQRIVVEK
jgi:hypothetical protein